MSGTTTARHTAARGGRRRSVPRPAQPVDETLLAGEARAGSREIDRVRRIGLVIIVLQLAGFSAWSWLLYHRFALTWDFGVYHQPWYLIAHGHLDPPTTIESMPFWRNDAEFAIWPLAILWWIPPHDVMLLWAQDAGVCAAEALALGWMCRAARRAPSGAWLAAAGLALLVVSPWIWWSV